MAKGILRRNFVEEVIRQTKQSKPRYRDAAPRSARSRGAVVQRRNDLDGLRAVAVVLVVVYHVWVGRVSGGVDVFLMLSAFFMVASLVKRADRKDIRVGRYFVHRFWRLIPPAVITILLTLTTILVLYPTSFWPAAWSQSRASLLYYENWELAISSADYYARDESSMSAFQHFWSLSIQGQVFILWPLLILLVAAVVRRTRLNLRATLAVVFGLIFVASLAYSIISTSANQQFAYFDTFARLWEFALGSLLALISFPIPLPKWLSEIFAWIGIIGLVSCGMIIDVAGGFPGYLALWPTLSAALLIVTGLNPASKPTTVARMLSVRPLRAMGSIAYPLYLVHWPVLVTWIVVTENASPTFAEGGIIVAISLALAIAIHLLVEKPVAKITIVERQPRWGAVAILALLSTVIMPATTWQVMEQSRALQIAADNINPGAAVLDDPDSYDQIALDPQNLIPVGTLLTQQWVQLDGYCDGRDKPSGKYAGMNCIEKDAPDGADRMIVIGDSHAQQWAGAFIPIAEQHELKLSAMVLSACSFTLFPSTPSAYQECDDWREQVGEYLEEDPPEYVVLVGTLSRSDSDAVVMRDGLRETVEALTDLGISVILLRDNPRYSEDMYRCAEDNLDDPAACETPREEVMASGHPLAKFDNGENVFTVDLTDSFCPDDVCRAVIGNIALYIDNHHITWDYMRTLAPRLESALEEAGLRW